MANILQAKKRIRQNYKRHNINKSRISKLRNSIKNFLKAYFKKDINYVKFNYSILVSLIDKSHNRGIIHLNKASRLKSRLNLKFKSLLLNI